MKKLAILATYFVLTGFSFGPSAKDIFKDNQDITACDTRQMNKSICYEYVIRKHIALGDRRDYVLGRPGDSVQVSLYKNLGDYGLSHVVTSSLREQGKLIERFDAAINEIKKIPANSSQFREAVSGTGAFAIVDELNEQTAQRDKLSKRIQDNKERLKQYQAKAEALKAKYAGMDEVFDRAVDSVIGSIGKDIAKLDGLEQTLASANAEVERAASTWKKIGEVYQAADAKELDLIKQYAANNGMLGFQQGLGDITNSAEAARKLQNYMIQVDSRSTYSWLYDDIYYDKSRPKLASFVSKTKPAILRVDFNLGEGRGVRRNIDGHYLKLVKVEEFKTALGDAGFMVYFEDLELNYNSN